MESWFGRHPSRTRSCPHGTLISGVPYFARPACEQQCFDPSIRELLPVSPGDRIVGRSQFAEEYRSRIFTRVPSAPRSETLPPPFAEQGHPFGVLWKI